MFLVVVANSQFNSYELNANTNYVVGNKLFSSDTYCDFAKSQLISVLGNNQIQISDKDTNALLDLDFSLNEYDINGAFSVLSDLYIKFKSKPDCYLIISKNSIEINSENLESILKNFDNTYNYYYAKDKKPNSRNANSLDAITDINDVGAANSLDGHVYVHTDEIDSPNVDINQNQLAYDTEEEVSDVSSMTTGFSMNYDDFENGNTGELDDGTTSDIASKIKPSDYFKKSDLLGRIFLSRAFVITISVLILIIILTFVFKHFHMKHKKKHNSGNVDHATTYQANHINSSLLLNDSSLNQLRSFLAPFDIVNLSIYKSFGAIVVSGVVNDSQNLSKINNAFSTKFSDLDIKPRLVTYDEVYDNIKDIANTYDLSCTYTIDSTDSTCTAIVADKDAVREQVFPQYHYSDIVPLSLELFYFAEIQRYIDKITSNYKQAFVNVHYSIIRDGTVLIYGYAQKNLIRSIMDYLHVVTTRFHGIKLRYNIKPINDVVDLKIKQIIFNDYGPTIIDKNNKIYGVGSKYKDFTISSIEKNTVTLENNNLILTIPTPFSGYNVYHTSSSNQNADNFDAGSATDSRMSAPNTDVPPITRSSANNTTYQGANTVTMSSINNSRDKDYVNDNDNMNVNERSNATYGAMKMIDDAFSENPGAIASRQMRPNHEAYAKMVDSNNDQAIISALSSAKQRNENKKLNHLYDDTIENVENDKSNLDQQIQRNMQQL